MRRPITTGSGWLSVAIVSCALSCGAGVASPITALRFYNRDPITHVNDRRPVPRPTERVTGAWRTYVNTRVGAPLLRTLSFPPPAPALDVNAFGEVPDSTWFQNRIGVRDVSAQELAAGAYGVPPNTSAPWIVAERTSDTTLLAADGRARMFELRFDAEAQPELATGAEMVMSRLLFAAGYNVASNRLLCVRRADLVAGPEVARDVDRLLALTPKATHGDCFRVVATDAPAGQPIDAFAPSGVRSDDPNDGVPHERRRSLRGASVFYAWTGDTVMQQANTLDMWIETPRGSHRGYLVHYLRDFSTAFGAAGLSQVHEHDGFSTHFDAGYAVQSFFSLGLWERPWESIEAPVLVGVGRYEAAHFDPSGWSTQDTYQPFAAADRVDRFWAAKILARFSPEQIAVAVAQGEYSDPKAGEYLVRVLLARQRKLIERAFSEVAPLDQFELEPTAAGFRLCAKDLLLAYGLDAPDRTSYTARAYNEFGAELDRWREAQASVPGSVCFDGVEPSAAANGYAMLALTLTRAGKALPPVVVHMALVPRTAVLRIIGIERR
jgi:hypothetical protein